LNSSVKEYSGEFNIRLIFAKGNDCDLLFGWANDPTVRANSFNINPIPYEDHVDWFTNKLNSPTTLIFIAYEKVTPVGQIRIEVEGSSGVVNFSISKEFRGKGYGTEMLKLVGALVKKNSSSVTQLIGKVKKENIASQKAFENAGFLLESEEDYLVFVKTI